MLKMYSNSVMTDDSLRCALQDGVDQAKAFIEKSTDPATRLASRDRIPMIDLLSDKILRPVTEVSMEMTIAGNISAHNHMRDIGYNLAIQQYQNELRESMIHG